LAYFTGFVQIFPLGRDRLLITKVFWWQRWDWKKSVCGSNNNNNNRKGKKYYTL